jgi:hypothetical protein
VHCDSCVLDTTLAHYIPLPSLLLACHTAVAYAYAPCALLSSARSGVRGAQRPEWPATATVLYTHYTRVPYYAYSTVPPPVCYVEGGPVNRCFQFQVGNFLEKPDTKKLGLDIGLLYLHGSRGKKFRKKVVGFPLLSL